MLLGGDGNDVIIAGEGDDTVVGGPGADQINVVDFETTNDDDDKRIIYESLDDVGGLGNALHGGDVIYGFDAGGANGDTIDLAALFDSLGVTDDDATRQALTDLSEFGTTDVWEVRIDAVNAGGTFETLVVTVQVIDGSLGNNDIDYT